MPLIQSAWYLDQKFVGECEIPLTSHENLKGGTAPLAIIQSTHYISPFSGRIWASVEHLGYDWMSYIIPAPDEKATWSRGPGQLWLEWHYGSKIYEPEFLVLIPTPILQVAFRHQCAMYDLERNSHE